MDLWELESLLQSATLAETHHNATIYKKRQLSFGARTDAVFRKKHREATRRVHTTIQIKIQQVLLNLTCSEGNPTECRPRVTGLRQLNNVS